MAAHTNFGVFRADVPLFCCRDYYQNFVGRAAEIFVPLTREVLSWLVEVRRKYVERRKRVVLLWLFLISTLSLLVILHEIIKHST